MKRAYPEWIGEAGDRLPAEVWRILFPIRYEDAPARRTPRARALDPALVAALILPGVDLRPRRAEPRRGARPHAGDARHGPAASRARHGRSATGAPRSTTPARSLDFGTHYLRQMSDRFDGRVEQVLAAYNAGPHRVDAWTASAARASPPRSSWRRIPFTETRAYVMIILASREQYRRLYGLGRAAPGPVSEGARP